MYLSAVHYVAVAGHAVVPQPPPIPEITYTRSIAMATTAAPINWAVHPPFHAHAAIAE
jgi:hypothetical protein